MNAAFIRSRWTNAAFIRMRRASGSRSEAGDEALAAQGLLHQIDGPGDPDEAGTLCRPRLERLIHDLGRHGIAELRTRVAIARPRRTHRALDVVRSEPREHQRLASQHLVAAVLR